MIISGFSFGKEGHSCHNATQGLSFIFCEVVVCLFVCVCVCVVCVGWGGVWWVGVYNFCNSSRWNGALIWLQILAINQSLSETSEFKLSLNLDESISLMTALMICHEVV